MVIITITVMKKIFMMGIVMTTMMIIDGDLDDDDRITDHDRIVDDPTMRTPVGSSGGHFSEKSGKKWVCTKLDLGGQKYDT